jgi:hypothetical protein
VTTLKGNKRKNKDGGKVLRKKARTKINRRKERRNGKDKLFFLPYFTGLVLVILRFVLFTKY